MANPKWQTVFNRGQRAARLWLQNATPAKIRDVLAVASIAGDGPALGDDPLEAPRRLRDLTGYIVNWPADPYDRGMLSEGFIAGVERYAKAKSPVNTF